VARGFTLIELVVTLLIASILAVAAWPRGPAKESLTLNGRADQLASDIRYVQTLSMTRGSRFCLVLTSSSYELQTTAANVCTGTQEPHPAALVQPITLCAGCMSWTNLPSNNVQFNGLGQPYTAAATALASNAVITLNDNGVVRTVTISPVTGRVLVQ
jgi:prepilin-type N-terminal cleavage/methylation domain-containing protein